MLRFRPYGIIFHTDKVRPLPQAFILPAPFWRWEKLSEPTEDEAASQAIGGSPWVSPVDLTTPLMRKREHFPVVGGESS